MMHAGPLTEERPMGEIRIPSTLMIGGGSFAETATLLQRLECRRPLIVTDPFLMKGELPQRLKAQIQKAGLSCEVFHETVADPTTEVVGSGVAAYLKGEHDSLVSLGGGSPID